MLKKTPKNTGHMCWSSQDTCRFLRNRKPPRMWAGCSCVTNDRVLRHCFVRSRLIDRDIRTDVNIFWVQLSNWSSLILFEHC